jgi:hypothetical protein
LDGEFIAGGCPDSCSEGEGPLDRQVVDRLACVRLQEDVSPESQRERPWILAFELGDRRADVSPRPREVAQEDVSVGKGGMKLAGHRCCTTGLDERLLEASNVARKVGADACENLCTFGSRLELAQECAEEFVGSLPPASSVVESGRGEPSPPGGMCVLIGCESCCELCQVCSLIRRAAPRDDSCRCLQGHGNLLVGRRGRGGEVACPFLRVTHGLGESSMHRLLCNRVRTRKDGSRKQRMRELDLLSCDLDDVCSDGGTECERATFTGERTKKRKRRGSGRSGDGEHLDRVGPECSDASFRDLLQRFGQRKLVQRRGARRLGVGASELERKERVAPCELVQAPKHRPRQADAEPIVNDAVNGALAKRAEPDSFVLDRGKRTSKPGGLLAPAQEQRKCLPAQPAQCELERGRRRRVHPLHVVDDKEDRPALAESGDGVQEAEAKHTSSIVDDVGIRVYEQNSIERAPLRYRQ